MKDNLEITINQLKSNGFEDITSPDEKEHFNNLLGITDYAVWREWISLEREKPILITMTKGLTNNNSLWNCHVDNSDCDSIASVDLSYTWQFNMLMEILGSKFRF